jgi:excisionase family DNA binding protein
VSAEPTLTLALPDELIEQVAQRAAALLAERTPSASSPWLDTKGAAEYMAASPSRVHDLVQLGRLHPRRDGRRLLFKRDDIDAYIEENAS